MTMMIMMSIITIFFTVRVMFKHHTYSSRCMQAAARRHRHDLCSMCPGNTLARWCHANEPTTCKQQVEQTTKKLRATQKANASSPERRKSGRTLQQLTRVRLQHAHRYALHCSSVGPASASSKTDLNEFTPTCNAFHRFSPLTSDSSRFQKGDGRLGSDVRFGARAPPGQSGTPGRAVSSRRPPQ